ncbi:MAG: hypothetical protein JO301_10200 [Chitinophagaceae bacterium]|nr:hypothetical protein [Chitinophagaceae bacterium]
MRSHYWLLLAAGFAAFSSCQKSYNPPDLVISGGTGSGGTGSGSTGSKLVKYESKGVNTSESTTITYQYDASGRLTRYDETYVDSSNVATSFYFKYNRDASGKVTQVVTNELAASAPGQGYPDTVVYNIHYPGSSSNFDYARYSMDLGGGALVFRDSSVFVYNGAGEVTDKYSYFGAGPTPLNLSGHYQYTYSNGNITILKIFDPSSSQSTPYGTFNFQYDDKPASLYLGNESYLPGLDEGFSSKNNPVKYTITGSGLNESVSYSYQYNTDQRPVTGIIYLVPGKVAYNVKYTYQ